MRRLFLLALAVGIGAGLGFWQTLQTNPLTTPSAAIWLPLYLGGLVAAFWVLIRLFLAPKATEPRMGGVFVRQGILFGLTVGVLLYLQGLRVISLTDAALIVAAAGLFEMFFGAEKFDPTTTRRS